MDKLATIETDLTKAREALTALQDELPQYHALLTENERDVQRLKIERASLDAQAQARGRVEVAKEMLEQHHADIATARTEVDRLELAFKRESTLQTLTQHATDAARHKNAFDDRLSSANKALEGHVQKLLNAYDDLAASREAYTALVGDDKALERDLLQRGVSLAQGPVPYQPYAYPSPYGAVIGEVLMNLIVRRAQDAMNAEAGRQAALRAQRREAALPKLKGLCVDPGDADRAAERLGDLVRETTHQSRFNLGQDDLIIFGVDPNDLEQAEALLQGIPFVAEVDQVAHVR